MGMYGTDIQSSHQDIKNIMKYANIHEASFCQYTIMHVIWDLLCGPRCQFSPVYIACIKIPLKMIKQIIR